MRSTKLSAEEPTCLRSLLVNTGRMQVDGEFDGGGRAEQVAADGDEVNAGADEDEAVPDSVRERYDAVALEEDDADDVDDTTGSQLVQSRHLLLRRRQQHAAVMQTAHSFLPNYCYSPDHGLVAVPTTSLISADSLT